MSDFMVVSRMTSLGLFDEPVMLLELDPVMQPLPCQPPGTWAGREDRVRWLLHHLSDGEKAKLYELLHDALGLRCDAVRAIWQRERKALEREAGA